MNNNFSENLKKIRKDNNLSQEQLAEELGVSRQSISKWESASAYPEMDKIIALCDKFDMNIDDLLHKDIREVKEEEETKNKLNKYVENFLDFITDIINMFSSMNFKSKIKCIFEQIVITFVLLIFSLIIYIFGREIFTELFVLLPNRMYFILCSIIKNIFIVFCIISSIVILVHIFKTRYLQYYYKSKNNITFDLKEEVKHIEEKDITNHDINTCKEKIIIRDYEHSKYNFINILYNVIIGITKFFSVCILVCLSITLISLVALFIILFLISRSGYLFIGLISFVFGFSLINLILILMIFNFIFDRKNNKKKVIWCMISSFIIIGLSFGLIFVGTLDLTYINNDKIGQIEYEMQEDMFFNAYVDIEYVESNIDNVILEYKINSYCDVDSNINNNSEINLVTHCINPIEIVSDVISNINDEKIISINNNITSLKVYTSKDNINKLKKNKEEFNNRENEFNNMVNSYEIRINELEQENNELRNQLMICEN